MNLLSDSGQFSYIPATKNKNYDNAFFFMAVLGVSPDFEEAVLLLSGAAAVEELSADELERYESLSEHPLDLNSAGRSRLLSCGLFSAYQVASLLDYRNGTGDILSVSELGLVDGFSPGRAAALAHFVRLESRSSPGQRRSTRLRQSVTVGGSVRSGPQYGAKLKYDASLGQTAQLYWTTRTTYSAPEPRLGTMSLAYYGRRRLGKIVLGHFSARFGQGLALWSGFRMSSLSSVDAFSLRGSGFSPTGAADAALLGVASDWSFGRFTLGCAYSFKGRLPILALGWMSKKATIGLTATSRAASLDWRLSFPGLSAFGEFSSDYRLSLCGLAGLLWVPEYGRKYAFQARWFAPQYRNYSGLAAGVQLPWLVFTADAAYRNDRRTQQYKALLQFKPSLSVRDRVFVPALRASMRLRPGEASLFAATSGPTCPRNGRNGTPHSVSMPYGARDSPGCGMHRPDIRPNASASASGPACSR